jgi:hypothetical protein
MIKRVLIFPLASLLFVAAAVLLLLGSNLYTFHRLTDESPIAELRFMKTGSQEYEATIVSGDFCHPEKHLLYGDQWRLDAQFLKWRSWANLLGFDSMYRIERLAGRYFDVQEENSSRHVSYNLYPDEQLDLLSIMDSYDSRLSPVDTLYGSSVYDVMQEDTLYRVYRTQSGLLVRKARAVDIDNSVMTIEINKACGVETGWFGRLLQIATNRIYPGYP